MSARHLAWAMDQRAGSPGAKLLLITIGNFVAPDETEIEIEPRTLIAECEFTDETFSEALNQLEQQGLLRSRAADEEGWMVFTLANTNA